MVGAEQVGKPTDDEMLALITEVGAALNRCSYPTPQTGQVIQDICKAYDHKISTQVFPTYVLALDQQHNHVELATTGGSLRFDQVSDVETLVHRLRLGSMPVAAALEKLRAISAAPAPVNVFIRILGYVLMALGFALCFRMSIPATIAAVLIAIPIGAVQLWRGAKGALAALMPVFLTFIAALSITLWAVNSGFPDPVRVAVIPVLTLIPGAALTTALIELTAGSMISGASRLVSATVTLLSMAFGLALAVDIVGLPTGKLADLTVGQAPGWVLWIAAPIFAVGNILYFCTPRRAWMWMVLVAAGAFGLNHLLSTQINPAFAGGIALGAALLASWAINAHARENPSLMVLFLPTFWLLVPGSLGFVALSGTLTEDRELSGLGMSAALSLLSMAICMMVASVLAPFVTKRFTPVQEH